MAKRMIRDCTDSVRIDQLSWHAEVLFYRLMMKADDYGSFHANPKLLKSALFPLRSDSVRETDITRWLTELEETKNELGEKAGLILRYTAGNKPYLRILNFGQRLQAMKNKFPDPAPSSPTLLPKQEKGAPTVTHGDPPLELEVEIEVELETEMAGIFESVKKFFKFESELLYVSRWGEIRAFLNDLKKAGKLKAFKQSFGFYMKYKTDAKEKIHSWPSFVNGGWDQDNWEEKYKALKPDETKLGRKDFSTLKL